MDRKKLMPYVNRFKELLATRINRKNQDHQTNYYFPDKKPQGKSIVPLKPISLIVPEKPSNILDLYAPPGDYTGQPLSPWARKASNAPWAVEQDEFKKTRKNSNADQSLQEYLERREEWRNNFPQGRVTGRLRFTKTKSVQNLEALNRQAEKDGHGHDHDHGEGPLFDEYGNALVDKEEVNCCKQFKEYCGHTSLHGWRYLSEKKRNPFEKIFWLCWCVFGIGAAAYMMSKIWAKWERNPIITSVATTNYPVSSLAFPAVTICTVNKAATEKLIIQGCRYNFTLSQMRTIISILVDPDARNNDHINVEKNFVKPETALKYLRLVAPKCDDYLLSCRWNNAPALCTQMFRLVLTDSGYCCSFNAIETKKQRKDSKHDMEVAVEEQEYEYLQRAVWEFTDSFRSKTPIAGGSPGAEGGAETGTPVTDNFNCVREYDDDLFPAICQYLQKCRESERCRDRNRKKTNATSTQPIGSQGTLPFNFFSESFPLKVTGAGKSRGLTLMLDTLRCDTVPTDSFKGLRVLVHNADDFPAVAERGYIVGPGMETQIGVTAVDTYSGNALKGFAPLIRGCFFPSEFPLKFYKEYSRSACIVECETAFVNQECHCVTYFSPGNYSICNLKKYQDCVKKALDSIQKKTVPTSFIPAEPEGTIFNFKTKKDREQDKTCAQFCLPSCNETFYNVFVTAADFPNQPIANQTKMLREAIIEGGLTHLNDIKYVSGSISVLRIFFRESSIMQYKRDELYTWEDFVSAVGGVFSLCMGFSILSLVELFYFFTFRMHMDRRKWRKTTTVAEIAN